MDADEAGLLGDVDGGGLLDLELGVVEAVDEALLEVAHVGDLRREVLLLVHQALLLHVQVVHDQTQVAVHLQEVVDFRFHLHTLRLELLQLVFQRVDVPLQFLDLLVQHKLEFLEFLVFPLFLLDGFIFIFNCSLTLSDVFLDVFDLVFEFGNSGIDGFQILVEFLVPDFDGAELQIVLAFVVFREEELAVGVGQVVLLCFTFLFVFGLEQVQFLVLLGFHLLQVVFVVGVDYLYLHFEFIQFILFHFLLVFEFIQYSFLLDRMGLLFVFFVQSLLLFLRFFVELQLLDSLFFVFYFQLPFFIISCYVLVVRFHEGRLLALEVSFLGYDFIVDFVVLEFVVVDFVIQLAFLAVLVFVELLLEQLELHDGVQLEFLEFALLLLDALLVELLLVLVHEHHFVLGPARVLHFVELVRVLGVHDLPEDD